MTTASQSRPSRPAARTDWRSSIKTKGDGTPNRVVLHGVEGVGKTSFGAQAPAPIFIMARGETGLEKLIDNRRVDDTPHFPETQSWSDLLSQLEFLKTSDHDYKTVVIDTLNGCERLCHEHVCQQQYNGVWGKNGFTSYQQGYEVALSDWRSFLTSLDEINRSRKMSVLCLCHTKVAPFRNPEGADYDRYEPDMHRKTWGLTHKWADIVGFLNFETFVDDSGGRSKAAGGQSRMLYFEHHAAYDAKNRHGLPAEISGGKSAAEAWANFVKAL